MPLIVSPRQFTQRAEFYHQLAQCTSAGIPILRAVEQIKRSPPARSFGEPLQRLLDELAKGATLAESLQSLGWLPAFDLALIGAGEQSGRLDHCFQLLADYYNDRARIIKQVIAQLIYPVGLIHFAVVVFLIVLPFARSQFNASLPWLFVRAALIISPLYLAVVLMIYATQSKHGENWRATIESLLRPVPLLGTARHYLALSRLAAALEALISAGVNIFEAWDLAATASGSPALRRAVAAWKPRLVAGQMPSEAVRACPLFPEMFANLYASGEISGKLDDSLRHLNRVYSEEGASKLHTFAQWTPRLAYLLIVLVIAYEIVQFWIGIYGPHSELSDILRGFSR
jgi:general secretion pathway protein F/type IV pilus assembly protein PilC